jgi:hypothetical protein
VWGLEFKDLSRMKKMIYLTIVLTYVVAILMSLLVAYMPGAAIFSLQTILEPENIRSNDGYSYLYFVDLPTSLFPPEIGLLFEDGQQFKRSVRVDVTETGKGKFITDKSTEKGFYITFSTTDNSNPIANGRTYRFHSRTILLSRFMGIFYVSVLLVGGFRFVSFITNSREKANLRTLNGLVQILDLYRIHLKTTLSYVFAQSKAPWRSRLSEGGKLLVITAATAYGLIFIEWAFHVTKVSFMSGMSLGQKVEILLISGLALAAAGIAINIALVLFELLLRPLSLSILAIFLNPAVPAILLTALVILWLDSFTYTVFHFGILTSTSGLRMIYGLSIMLIFYGFTSGSSDCGG